MRSCALFVAFVAVLLSVAPSRAAQRITLTAGKTSILGTYLSGGFEIPVGDLTGTYGLTWSETLGVEPLVSLSYSRPVEGGWTLNSVVGYGGIGGDYRVNRLPEVRLTKSFAIPVVPFSYSLEVGAAYYTVRPADLAGFRGNFAVQLSMTPYNLSPSASLSGSVGYTYYLYTIGSPNGAAWGSATLALAHSPSLSTSFTYYRAMAAGSSPLLFDNIGEDNYVSGLVSLAVSPGVTVQHSQKYSFLSNSISERVYSVIVNIQPVSLTVSYNDVPQTWSWSLAFSQ